MSLFGNSNVDKILNTYLSRPSIRLSHINEIEDVRLDESLFKDYTDGSCQTTALYQDGANDFKHFSKLVISANTFPNIKIDTGVARRIDSFTHTSEFTKDKQNVSCGKCENVWISK